MAKSTAKRRVNKPAKPYPDFPLFPHDSGRWAKKIRGKLHYFGRWGNKNGPTVDWVDDIPASAQAALKRYKEQRDDLYAGRTPRPKTDELTVKQLADRFLTAKYNRVQTGELALASYRDNVYILQHVADVFGKHRPVVDLAADDFAALRQSFAKTHGPTRLGKDVVVTRSLFKWGFDAGLIEKPVRFGPEFRTPSRKSRLRATRENGRKDFDADEVRALLEAADGPMRAMILLGINAGLGQADIASLQRSHIADGVMTFPRPKTEVERRCPLWKETLTALAELKQPRAEDPADADCVFLTDRGTRVVRTTGKSRTDCVGSNFKRLMKDCGINGRRGFYSLRHTFATSAGESRDQPAVDLIMGHSDSSMAANYRHRISDERLQDVVNVVRAWLWPDDDAAGAAE